MKCFKYRSYYGPRKLILGLLIPFILILTIIDRIRISKTIILANTAQINKHRSLNLKPINYKLHPEKYKKGKYFMFLNNYARTQMATNVLVNSSMKCENRTNYLGWLNPAKNYKIQKSCGDRIELWENRRDTLFKATVLRDFLLDFRRGMPKARKQIQTSAQDGYFHDPRYKLTAEQFTCFCPQEEDRSFNDSQLFPMFRPHFGEPYVGESIKNYTCSDQSIDKVIDEFDQHDLIDYPEKTIIIGRFADHNPFFMINLALHAWLMVRNLKWDAAHTKVLILDDGCPTCGGPQPTIDLFTKLLGPVHYAKTDLNRKVTRFHQALFVPVEYHGPLATEADYGKTNCNESKMILDFKHEILEKFQVQNIRAKSTEIRRILFLERNNVDSRKLERQLLNQKDIFRTTKMFFQKYISSEVEIVGIDFANMSFAEQIHTARSADMLLGMHGAGMLHSLWLRQLAWVVEIFPMNRYRYTYYNICKFTGCQYAEFRDGQDSPSPGDNKFVPPVEWLQFLKSTFLHSE